MLKRIFVTQRFAAVAWAVMVFTIGWTVMNILMEALICRPIEMNWNPYTPGGKCGDQVTVFASIGIIDIVKECCILVLLIPMIWRLTLIFASVRLYNVLYLDFTDVSYSAVEANIYAVVEPGVAIIVSCSPILRPLFDNVFGRQVSSNAKSGSSEKGQHKVALETFGRSNREFKRRREIATTDGFTAMDNDTIEEIQLSDLGSQDSRRNLQIEATKQSESKKIA
ncbi:hypothetical protein PG994_004297 [Apiospora phragmitis]|uniref:Rhodopsin domain-containing protein n=1 Tax=Apiospora phragmitis TaxID=2905665 RepID=A0ABR1VU82_9PEZI